MTEKQEIRAWALQIAATIKPPASFKTLAECDEYNALAKELEERIEGRPKYLTISYHSDWHTSGKPPVDEKQYRVPVQEEGFWVTFPEDAILLEHGTLEMEGYRFHGWVPRQRNITSHPDSVLKPGDSVKVRENLDFDAAWWSRTNNSSVIINRMVGGQLG